MTVHSLCAVSPTTYHYLLGEEAASTEKEAWDHRYNKNNFYIFGKMPSSFLSDHLHYLPKEGSVLDIAMGEGRNAVFLAKLGYKVTGIDISSVAIKKAHQLAGEQETKIKTINASMNDHHFAPKSFDVILCFYYINRKTIRSYENLLKDDGVLMVESFSEQQKKVDGFPFELYSEEDFLQQGELLSFFRNLDVLKFEKSEVEGNYREFIIARKKRKGSNLL